MGQALSFPSDFIAESKFAVKTFSDASNAQEGPMLVFVHGLDSAILKNGGGRSCNDALRPLVLRSGYRAAAQPKPWGALERFITNAVYLSKAELVAVQRLRLNTSLLQIRHYRRTCYLFGSFR